MLIYVHKETGQLLNNHYRLNYGSDVGKYEAKQAWLFMDDLKFEVDYFKRKHHMPHHIQLINKDGRRFTMYHSDFMRAALNGRVTKEGISGLFEFSNHSGHYGVALVNGFIDNTK